MANPIGCPPFFGDNLQAKETIRALERLQAFVPLDLRNEIETLWNYIHQQIFIEEEMEKFTKGFGYKPDNAYKVYKAKYIEDTAISDPIRPK